MWTLFYTARLNTVILIQTCRKSATPSIYQSEGLRPHGLLARLDRQAPWEGSCTVLEAVIMKNAKSCLAFWC